MLEDPCKLLGMTTDSIDWELSNLQWEQHGFIHDAAFNLSTNSHGISTLVLEIKHLQIKRLLVKLESWIFFIKLFGGAYQRASYCTYIVICCMRVLLVYVHICMHMHNI